MPAEDCEKSLPAIVRMFENNAVFMENTYYSKKLIEPTINVRLSDCYKLESSGDQVVEVRSKPTSPVMHDEMMPFTPQLFLSNKEALEKYQKQLSDKNAEVQVLKSQLQSHADTILRLQDEVNVLKG